VAVRVALTILIASALTGCQSLHDWQMERSLERSRDKALASIDQEACAADGGRIEGVGMFGTPACVVPFADAGAPCSDDADCEGFCKAVETSVVGEASTGTCQLTSHDHFGCVNKVEGGVVVSGPCID
jgi:hypothetical protein